MCTRNQCPRKLKRENKQGDELQPNPNQPFLSLPHCLFIPCTPFPDSVLHNFYVSITRMNEVRGQRECGYGCAFLLSGSLQFVFFFLSVCLFFSRCSLTVFSVFILWLCMWAVWQMAGPCEDHERRRGGERVMHF